MQHKALLTALFCGALCLTGCIKNVESDSVTQIRNAKAQESLSLAELNKANAQAALIKANAEATIADAQAELIKAQAAKEQAEAALIQAQVELQNVEVQIALVRLEEEKVVLQQKKAELQKLIAEYEAAIADAEAAKQEAINRLNAAKEQANLNEIYAQMALIEAQKELMDATNAIEDEKRARLASLWVKYYEASNNYTSAQAQLIEKEVLAAQIEAGIVSGLEAKYEEAMDIQEAIAEDQALVESLSELAGKTYEELMAVYAEIMEKYDANVAARMAARNKTDVTYAAWQNVYEDPYAYGYTVPEFVNEWYGDGVDGNVLQQFILDYATATSQTIVKKLDEETGASIWGLTIDGEFVPFWKDEVQVTGDSYIYPAPKDGIMPKIYGTITDVNWAPAEIYFENYTLVSMAFSLYLAKLEQGAEEAYAEDHEDKEAEIKSLTDQLAAYQAYVDKADEQIIPAREARKAASEASNAARAAYYEARAALGNYQTSNTVWAEYMKAYSHYSEAVYNDNDVKDAISDLENSTIPTAEVIVANAKNEKYEADKAVATKQGEVKALKAKVTEAIVKAYTDAQEAVTKQEGVIKDKSEAYDKAVEEEKAAELVYLADPTNETKKTAWETKKTATQTALTAYNAEVAKLGPLNEALEAAKNAYDAVNDPYEAAVEELKGLEATAAEKAEALTAAEKNLADAKAEQAQLKEKKAETEAKVEETKAAMDAAKAAYDAVKDGTDPEIKALIEKRDEAWNVYVEKWNIYVAATNEYYTIVNAFEGFDEWNWDYEADAPYTYTYYTEYRIPELEEDLATAQSELATLEENYAALQKEIAAAEAEINNLNGQIEHFIEIEPAYTNWLEGRKTAYDNYVEAYKEYIVLLDEYYQIKAELEAFNTIYGLAIYSDGTYIYDFEDVLAYIAYLNEEIAALSEELATIQADMEKNYIDENYNITVYAQVVAEINKLQSQIEVYGALAESYWAEIQELIGTEDAVE